MILLRFLWLYLLISTFEFVVAVFNFEISAHVNDKISDYTNMITRSLKIPYYGYLSGVSNFTGNPQYIKTSQLYFYPLMLDFSEIQNSYAGYENGLFYGYAIDKSQKQGISFIHTSLLKGSYSVYYNSIGYDGAPIGNTFNNHSYDPRKRPWYQAAKVGMQSMWTEPYIDFGTGDPCLTLVIPLTNNTNLNTHGNVNGPSHVIGVIAVDVLFEAISAFLKSAYAGTDRNVFVVDKATLSLLGSSLDAKLYSGREDAKKLILATSSENSLICGATKLLITQGWPDKLLLFGENYLQNVLYKDSIKGLEWYIVVLLPADLQPDYLEPNSPTYAVVMAVASLALCCCVAALLCTLFWWNSKLMRLTQPHITVLILLGGVCLSVLCLLLPGPNTEKACAVRPYLFNLAFTLSFSPLVIKSWRVHVLLNLNPTSKAKLIGVLELVLYTFAFIVADLVLMLLTLYVNAEGTAPVTSLQLTSAGAYSESTHCGYDENYAFIFAEIGFKGLLVLSACFLSFKTRNVHGVIAGSRILLVIVYNTAVVAMILILIRQSLSKSQAILSQTIGICFCVILNCVLLVCPVAYQIVVGGDKAVANEVLDHVIAKRRDNSAAAARSAGAGSGKGAGAGKVLKPGDSEEFVRPWESLHWESRYKDSRLSRPLSHHSSRVIPSNFEEHYAIMAAMAFDARDAAAESSADTSGVFKSIAELRAERQAQNSVDEAVGGNSRRGSHDSVSSSVTAKSAPNPLRDAVGSTARARGLATSAAYQFGPPVGGPDLAARYADMAAMAFEAADTEASKVFRRANTPDFILEDDDTVDRLRTLDNRIIDNDAHSRAGGQWASAVSTGVIASSSGTAFSQRSAGYSGLVQQSLEGV